MDKIVKDYNFNLNGIDAGHLYYTFKKICLAYENAFHFGAPDEDKPNEYILELGNAVAGILQGDIHDFLDNYYDDAYTDIFGIGIHSKDELSYFENPADKTEILSGKKGEK